MKGKFNKSYDTIEVTKEIAGWFNSDENKKLFNLSELSRMLCDGNDRVIPHAILGIKKSINPLYVDRIVNIILLLGFESKYWKKDFDYMLTKAGTFFEEKKENIVSKSRLGKLPRIRKYLMKIGQDPLRLSSSVIGKKLGGLKHCTVLTGIKTLNGWLENNPEIQKEFKDFKNYLNL